MKVSIAAPALCCIVSGLLSALIVASPGCDTSQLTLLPILIGCPERNANPFEGLEFEADPDDPCVTRYVGDPNELPTFEDWVLRAECEIFNAPDGLFRQYRFYQCESANALQITESSGVAGSVAFFDMDTRRIISFASFGDILIDDPPCDGVTFLFGRVDCDDAALERELFN